jgi:hypothetical protein
LRRSEEQLQQLRSDDHKKCNALVQKLFNVIM